MSLIVKEPDNFFRRFHDDFNHLFQSFNNYWPSTFTDEDSDVVTSEWMPSVDIVEQNDKFVINADIPGVDPKDIEVSMDNGTLSIKGERKQEKTDKKNGYHRHECSRGLFYRRFSLPDTADPKKISAKGKDGVLKITLGKRTTSKPKLISVQQS